MSSSVKNPTLLGQSEQPVGRVTGFAFFFIPVGYMIFRAGEMNALRTGKPKRNG